MSSDDELLLKIEGVEEERIDISDDLKSPVLIGINNNFIKFHKNLIHSFVLIEHNSCIKIQLSNFEIVGTISLYGLDKNGKPLKDKKSYTPYTTFIYFDSKNNTLLSELPEPTSYGYYSYYFCESLFNSCCHHWKYIFLTSQISTSSLFRMQTIREHIFSIETGINYNKEYCLAGLAANFMTFAQINHISAHVLITSYHDELSKVDVCNETVFKYLKQYTKLFTFKSTTLDSIKNLYT